jgi:prefoldin subunit 5
MNIDERLEALTMNLELAHRDIQDLRASVQEITANVGELTGTVRSLAAVVQAGFADTRLVFETVHDSIRMLENIVVAHQQKLEELGNNTDQP